MTSLGSTSSFTNASFWMLATRWAKRHVLIVSCAHTSAAEEK